MVLAGGEGKRLMPLTLDRAKPAVPFGGHYRLIDFALSNLANGGFLKIVVLTQYKSHSLDLHISRTWRMSTLLGNYVAPVPAQMRRGPQWFSGSADAVFQNLNIDRRRAPRLHLRLRRRPHLPDGSAPDARAAHRQRAPGSPWPASGSRSSEADQFGVIEPARRHAGSARFLEKPTTAGRPARRSRPGASPRWATTSSRTDVLIDALHADAGIPTPTHDMGGDMIPTLVAAGEAHVYDFADNHVPGRAPSATRATGATSARSTATTTPHGPGLGPSGLQPLQPRLADLHAARASCPPAKFVFEEPGRTGRRSTRSSAPA